MGELLLWSQYFTLQNSVAGLWQSLLMGILDYCKALKIAPVLSQHARSNGGCKSDANLDLRLDAAAGIV
jgi:hypothetical protein